MSEIVGQLRVDFDVIQSTTRTLWIGDNSDWVYAKTLPSYIYITLPGSKKALEFLFLKNQINNFNSSNLGISCITGECTEETYIDLKDGIYTIILKSAYTSFEKTRYYLKTDKIELDLAKAIVDNGLDYSSKDKGFREVMLDIDWLLKVAKSLAKLGDFTKASRFYEVAKSKLKDFSECKNCI